MQLGLGLFYFVVLDYSLELSISLVLGEVLVDHLEQEPIYFPFFFHKLKNNKKAYALKTLKTFVASLSKETILTNVEEALKDPKWKEAINVEIKVLRKNNT